MLKKVTTLNCEIVGMLCSFANTKLEDVLEGKETDYENFKYKDLLITASLPENANNMIDVSKQIDQLMFDNYNIYLQMKEKLSMMDNVDTDEIDFKDELSKTLFLEAAKVVKKYIKTYKNLLLTTKFEYPNIRQIQKYALQDELNYNISIENYEECMIIKEKMEEV